VVYFPLDTVPDEPRKVLKRVAEKISGWGGGDLSYSGKGRGTVQDPG